MDPSKPTITQLISVAFGSIAFFVLLLLCMQNGLL